MPAFRTPAALFVLAMVAIAPLEAVRAQDAERGEKLFRRCSACHTLEEGAKSRATGPNLFGVIGSVSGTRDVGFKFSKKLVEAEVEWTEENLDKWLENPQKFIKGSRMTLRLSKEDQRQDVIAYLKETTQ